ncbi:hypothetical protein AAKU55_005566 [Oxalobacteraceae bacterium GrIS 1.11]
MIRWAATPEYRTNRHAQLQSDALQRQGRLEIALSRRRPAGKDGRVPADKRDIAAARRFFDKAIRDNSIPAKVAMDKSGANKAAGDVVNAGRDVPGASQLNDIVEQDLRAIKRVSRSMLTLTSLRRALQAGRGLLLNIKID